MVEKLLKDLDISMIDDKLEQALYFGLDMVNEKRIETDQQLMDLWVTYSLKMLHHCADIPAEIERVKKEMEREKYMNDEFAKFMTDERRVEI